MRGQQQLSYAPNSTAAGRNWRRQPHSSCRLESQCSGDREEEEGRWSQYLVRWMSRFSNWDLTCSVHVLPWTAWNLIATFASWESIVGPRTATPTKPSRLSVSLGLHIIIRNTTDPPVHKIIWNSLPASLRNLPILSEFKSSQLKTFLSSQAYVDHFCELGVCIPMLVRVNGRVLVHWSFALRWKICSLTDSAIHEDNI